MKIGGVGAGFGLPKTNLQVSAANMMGIHFRRHRSDTDEVILALDDLFCFGGKSGTFLFSGFITKCFDLPPTAKELLVPNTLKGKMMEIKMEGVVGGIWGTVDVYIKTFDKYLQPKYLLERCCVAARGIKFSELKVRGRIRDTQRFKKR
jgi:hypothetical protein